MADNLEAEIFKVETTSPERMLSMNTFRIGFRSRVMHEPFDQLKHTMTRLKVPRVDLAKYGLVVIITPIWGTFFPPAVNTFLELNHFKGRKVAFIATAAPMATTREILDYSERQLERVKANLIFRTEVKLFQQGKRQLAEKGTQLASIISRHMA